MSMAIGPGVVSERAKPRRRQLVVSPAVDLITSKQQALGVFPQADLVRLLPTQKSRRHRQQPQAVCPSFPQRPRGR